MGPVSLYIKIHQLDSLRVFVLLMCLPWPCRPLHPSRVVSAPRRSTSPVAAVDAQEASRGGRVASEAESLRMRRAPNVVPK